MEPRHQAVAAGLALTLALGTASAPATTYADTGAEARAVASTSAGTDGGASSDGTLPAPGAYDRSLDYEEASDDTPSLLGLSLRTLASGASTRITPQALSSEMKYFAQNESGSNYNLGFSYGDGYNAMGFYQFDRRYALVPFMEACYAYNPEKYSMFKPVIDRGRELKTAAIYDSATKRLTEIGQLAEDAWHAAYAADPAEFSALQDAYGYQEYYLPIERTLKREFGLDISGRADCVKGLAWGLSNLFGTGGCEKFFRDAKLSNEMSDREFVNALCDSVVTGVKKYGYAYADSYVSRYERERATCLKYIAQHEAAGDESGEDGAEDDAAPAPDAGGSSDVEETPGVGEQVGSGNEASDNGAADDGESAENTDDGQVDAGDAPEHSADEGNAGDGGAPSEEGSDTEDPSGVGDASEGESQPAPPVDESDDSQGDAESSGVSQEPGQSGQSEESSSGDVVSGGEGDASNSDDKVGTGSGEADNESDDGTQKVEENLSSGGKTDEQPKGDDTGKKNPSEHPDSDAGKLSDTKDDSGSQKSVETLPQTGDPAALMMTASAVLSGAGAAAVAVGGRLGKRDPYEDGFDW